MFNSGNRFFQSAVFLYFTKIVAAMHSSMGTVFILQEHLHPYIVCIQCRGGSRTAATSKMERFVVIVNAAVLDPPLQCI